MITIKNTGSEEATIKNITETLNAKMGTSEKPVSSKKVGYIVRNHLKLETARTREGYTIDLARSAGKIKKLSYKYGVDYARVNIVNDAGAVDSHNDEIKDSDIPF